MTPLATQTLHTVRSISAGPSVTGHVTADNLRVRGGPGLEYPVLGQLREEEPVEVIGVDETANWLQIRTPVAGWVSSTYVVFASEPRSSMNLPVATARPTNTAKPPTPLPQAAVAPVTPRVQFFASPTKIVQGACAILTWHVEGVKEVFLSGNGVEGHGSQEICPQQTTAYQLHVAHLNGTTQDFWLTVGVSPAPTIAPISIIIVWPTPPPTQTPWIILVTPTPTATPTTAGP